MPKATRTDTTPEHRDGRRMLVSVAPTVPEHTPTRRSPRRRFLLEAGATVATALGVTAAVLAPDPVWGAAPAADAGPDDTLIGACRAFDALEAEEAALYRSARTIEAEEHIEPQAAALSARMQPLVATICALRATTPAGHLARARTLALLEGIPPGVAAQEDVAWTKRIVAALARDLAHGAPA